MLVTFFNIKWEKQFREGVGEPPAEALFDLPDNFNFERDANDSLQDVHGYLVESFDVKIEEAGKVYPAYDIIITQVRWHSGKNLPRLILVLDVPSEGCGPPSTEDQRKVVERILDGYGHKYDNVIWKSTVSASPEEMKGVERIVSL